MRMVKHKNCVEFRGCYLREHTAWVCPICVSVLQMFFWNIAFQGWQVFARWWKKTFFPCLKPDWQKWFLPEKKVFAGKKMFLPELSLKCTFTQFLRCF